VRTTRCFFEIGAVKRSGSGGYISLIAIEDWNLHADFGDAFPAFGVVGGVEDFVVVFHAAAELEIGNGFAFGAGEFAEARAALISAMRLAGDCVAMDSTA